MFTLLIASILIAIIAGALGFTRVSAAAAGIARLIAAIFAALALILILMILAGVGSFAAWR